MDITIIWKPVLEAIAFAVIVATVEMLLLGVISPWPWPKWRAHTWVFFWFCLIIIVGVIKL